ncbi:MAG TPA: site-2 protease family protein [Acidimicrobiales bacterium]|jgi:Zn-dependent protease
MRRYAHPQALVAIGLIAVALYAVRHTFGSTTVVVFALVVPSIILHELAHGVCALAFGDDTAKKAGRLTLNPIRHVDPMGTLVLPGLLALAGLGAFGYAKPVPINPAKMRHPRNSSLIVSLAGPATNLALAGISILALRLLRPRGTARMVNFVVSTFGVGTLDLTDRVLYLLGFINVTLAVFNALPIPPLDGSALVARLLPPSALPGWYTFQRYAMPVLLVLVLLQPGNFLVHVFGPAQRAWARLLAD